ncbi:RxLR-like protein [Plasmopara halstedii]|uniref:RxLR-like protein n=1 Tax=Plasmopara halstedii TaxID=4781 RepID=A0A0P1ANE6_PLAHL|nr:RxLR-like protein [Plasmopara halstedii]CEG42541.1 RxLR-like protein [Plasmopara halstedii]|eukprot:XP_024578910.1 RxLR-like protein [Plasmopara halstedii]
MRVRLAVLALLVGATVVQTATRIRKSWTTYSSDEKEQYLSAIKKAMTSGNHMLFTQMYMDSRSLDQVVGTCGAPAWYRKYLLGYENMLRSLDSTFSDLTLPYWDLFEDSAKRISTTTVCNGIEGCSPILADLGGCEGPELNPGDYVLNGEIIPSGNCANTSVAAHACTISTKCERCIPRGEWNVGDSSLEVGPSTFADLIRHASDATGMDTLRKEIQNSIQMTVHSILGGVYETRAATFDPIFFSHYATIDMVYQFYQSCNQSIPLTGSCRGRGNLKISPTVEIPMYLRNVPISLHAKLSKYFHGVGTTFKSMDAFAVEYEISPFLQNVLKKFSLQCEKDKSATGAISYARDKSTFEDAVGIDTLVNDLAACDRTSKIAGDTTEAPSAFISCQLLSSLQNGVFTNFSTPVREFFGATQDDLPKCVGDLAAITSTDVAVTLSATCHEAMYRDTSISSKTDFNLLTDGFAIVTKGAKDGVRYMNPPSK